MKINLKFYKGKDVYSDGDIENKIISFIKSNKTSEEVFSEDGSWPVYYHISNIRRNILSWYPFKKNSSILEIGAGMGAITSLLCEKAKRVVCVEASKRRAEAIRLRTKDFDNGEIIVGNFNDIKFEEKFDYITLIGVFEYALMFTDDKENAYTLMLESVKKLLKPNGKILIAIENRFGLKYWLGAKEDHTSRIYDGINNYELPNDFVRTFSKNDLECMFDNVNLKYNFYYVLPDYKFPELILTDEILSVNSTHTYTPYYCSRFNMFANEKKLFDDVLKNHTVPFFANSYLIELSNKETQKEVTYAKYNNYRCNQYSLLTYKKGNKYFKRPLFHDGVKHINDLCIYSEMLNNLGVNSVNVNLVDDECYTTDINMSYTLMDELVDLFKNGKYKQIYKKINSYIVFLKRKFRKSGDISKTIFEELNVKIPDEQKNELYFVEDGYIDLCFQNIFVKKNEYVVIDQEWFFKNTPIEYIIYRSVMLFVRDYLKQDTSSSFFSDLIKNININIMNYSELFENLNESFMSMVNGRRENINTFNVYNSYLYALNSVNISSQLTDVIENCLEQAETISNLNDQIKSRDALIQEKDQEIRQLSDSNNSLKNNYDLVINSKTWKIRNKICKIIRRK